MAEEWRIHARPLYASQTIGVAQAALDLAIEWVTQRKTFGTTLAEKQAIQWMIADSEIELRAARLLTYQGAWNADLGRDIKIDASVAKVYGTEVAGKVSDRCIQMFGGMGVAIVTGAGEKSFTTGADIKSFLTAPAELSDMWMTQRGQLLNRGLEVCKPIVAAVNATAWAARWGLINKVVAKEALLDTAMAYAKRIAANAPLAVQAAKDLARRSREMDRTTGLRFEAVINRMLSMTEDAKEGPAAFAAKRAPVFHGR